MDVPEELVITDPEALRSLTNPVRLVAVNELYTTQAETTATDLADLCGVSPSSMSYHLRALESFGIVRRAPQARDGRQRPWLAAARSYLLNARDDLGEADRERLIDTYLDPMRARMQNLFARRARVPEEEQDTLFTILATGELMLTEDETRELRAAFEALVRRYEELSWLHAQERESPRADDDAALVRARVLWSLLPDNPALFNLTADERAARAREADTGARRRDQAPRLPD